MANRRKIDKEEMFKRIMPSKNTNDDIDNLSIVRNVSPPSIRSVNKSVVNIVEYAVKEKIDESIDRFKGCKCDRCKKDVIAITLNKIPQKYKVIDDIDLEKEIKQYDSQVNQAIVQAMIKVKAEPRH